MSERGLPEGLDKNMLPKRERKGKYGRYAEYLVPNDDPYTLDNTVLKMAKNVPSSTQPFMWEAYLASLRRTWRTLSTSQNLSPSYIVSPSGSKDRNQGRIGRKVMTGLRQPS